MAASENPGPGYFTFPELGLIFLLALLAVLTGIYLPALLPGGSISVFVYDFLGLPGPGAGVLVFGSIPCFFMILGMLLLKKPWTGILVSVFIIAVDLLMAYQASLHTLDVYLFAAIIIEVIVLIPVGRSPWKYVMPGILALLGILAIAICIMGSAGVVAAAFAPACIAIGMIGLLYAVACYYYPLKLLIAGGVANLYFVMHYFLFWGEGGFASAIPVLIDLPVVLLIALVGGLLSATAAYGVDLLVDRFMHGGKTIKKVN